MGLFICNDKMCIVDIEICQCLLRERRRVKCVLISLVDGYFFLRQSLYVRTIITLVGINGIGLVFPHNYRNPYVFSYK